MPSTSGSAHDLDYLSSDFGEGLYYGEKLKGSGFCTGRVGPYKIDLRFLRSARPNNQTEGRIPSFTHAGLAGNITGNDHFMKDIELLNQGATTAGKWGVFSGHTYLDNRAYNIVRYGPFFTATSPEIAVMIKSAVEPYTLPAQRYLADFLRLGTIALLYDNGNPDRAGQLITEWFTDNNI